MHIKKMYCRFHEKNSFPDDTTESGKFANVDFHSLENLFQFETNKTIVHIGGLGKSGFVVDLIITRCQLAGDINY